MSKKFLNAIMIVFTFLLFVLLGNVKVEAETLPASVMEKAGIGEKKGYWAVINYGEEYIGNVNVTIDIDRAAIDDEEVNWIVIAESGYSGSITTYQRYVDEEFSGKINYILKNKAYGEKYLTILLLREFVANPDESLIVDKIMVGMHQIRNISSINSETDILITREYEEGTSADGPYNVNVSLNPDTIEGGVNEYLLKSVKYTLLNDNKYGTRTAIYESKNSYNFEIDRNGTYEVTIEDIFGYTKTKSFTVTNMVDPAIVIEAYPEVTGYTNQSYAVNVKVKRFGGTIYLNTGSLKELSSTFNGVKTDIRTSKSFMVTENGQYIIYAETNNGSSATYVYVADNLDFENPYAQVLEATTVYTESVKKFFNPENDVFAYDNMSKGENLTITMTYYKTIGTSNSLGEYYTEDKTTAINYLYTVRNLIVRYKITDEAGNSIEKDSLIIVKDNTKPIVTYAESRMLLYINDPYPTQEELEEAYGIIVKDNSLYEGSNRTITYNFDFSDLPVDEENKLNKLGEYRIYISAKDESENESDSVVLTAEVRRRLITVEADDALYIVYGDEMIDISKRYHCVTRKGESVDCSEELLQGDTILGDLYMLNANYSGSYEIYYDFLTIPSDLYYLEYGETKYFEIKKRTIRIVAQDKEKIYLDDDPELTYSIDTSVCLEGADESYKDYRCTLLEGDFFAGSIARDSSSPTEEVWYDENGNILPRAIYKGTLYVNEQYSGGKVNYYLDFVNAEFTIWPKYIQAYINDKEKIYGENDPVYDLRDKENQPSCVGKTGSVSKETFDHSESCMNEMGISLSREANNVDSENIGKYKINGYYTNKNYIVEFTNSYLTINKRDISISVTGDLDDNSNPTGKYTIYYEDVLPVATVYDSSTGSKTGLANNTSLSVPLEDKFYYGEAYYYNGNQRIEEYVSGIGSYRITKGTIRIVTRDGIDAEENYNITFNEGELEVIKKSIWITIIEDLNKIYGDDDPAFTNNDLLGYDENVILEANNRYIIKITSTKLNNEEKYIPRDNLQMKYHLNRDTGIYVGKYKIYIEKLEGCENYDVYLYEKYYFEILKRDILFDLNDVTLTYKDELAPLTYKEDIARSSLQYNDTLIGEPAVEEYTNVGVYTISRGTIGIIDENNNSMDFNYNITVKEAKLTIIQRIIMVSVRANQSKLYGEFDPGEDPSKEDYKKSGFLFDVYRCQDVGEESLTCDEYETIDESEYTGRLARLPDENGESEIPDAYYTLTIGTLEINKLGVDSNGNPLGNYFIYEFNNNNKFYIAKRTILVKARKIEAIYGNDYNKDILYDTIGNSIAYNLALKINGIEIDDKFTVERPKIIGTVDGVGTYIISCEDVRIVRRKTGEDVTDKYYDFTYENDELTILPRKIYIHPLDGQQKIYGEDDPVIEYTYEPSLLMSTDVFSGELKREPRIINDEEVMEDVGEYNISLGTLTINKNYELIAPAISKTFSITARKLNVIANDLGGNENPLYYGDSFELTYRIEGDGLADNDNLNIHDKITGTLNLDREYTGAGNYRILGDNLVVDNIRNYAYTFSPGLLIVRKRKLTIVPKSSSLYKVYGEKDPLVYSFDVLPENINPLYNGALTREPGENAGKYKILMGTLDFGENYEVTLETAYFTILARDIVVTPKYTEKIYGSEDPKIEYEITEGRLIGEDTFIGMLTRESGEEVGTYKILQGTLALTNNYNLTVNEGSFVIYYAAFTGITIYFVDNTTKYQVMGEEKEVSVYARFNAGADETHLGDVTWSIIKNNESEWDFSKDANNVVTFIPSGPIGTYEIKATYGGKTGEESVIVDVSFVGNISIELLDPLHAVTEQVLGNEQEVGYIARVPSNVGDNAVIQWLANGEIVEVNDISNLKFFYTPPAITERGNYTYVIQAKVGNKISNSLQITVRNNNPPVITLIGDSVIYLEAKQETYTELGATVYDDIDGDITENLIITGEVNPDVKGTYFIKYDAKDRFGNSAVSVYRQVIVRDTTPPVITVLGDREIVLLYGQQYIEYGATAVDNYDGEVDVIINNPIILTRVNSDPGYTVSYIAYDSSGNSAIETRNVKIIDNISPVITLVGDDVIYVEVYHEFEDPGAIVEDNVDGITLITGTSFYFGDEEVEFLDTGRLGTYYVRYDATDSVGNVGAGKVRTVIVRDTTPPVITLKGDNPYVIRYTYPTVVFTDPGATVIDNYDGEISYTRTGQLGNELGTYYLYYDAVDSNGNHATQVTREVVVIDIDSPILHFFDVCPQYITIEALYEEYDERCDAPGYGVWVEDDYKADIEELQKRIVVSGTVDSTTKGLYVKTYNVSDMAGNVAVTLNRYITVVDTTAPVITLIWDESKEDDMQIVEVFDPYIELGAEVYDRYDLYHEIEITITISNNVNVNKLGYYTAIYNAVDSSGNKATPVIRKIAVKDTKPPVITLIGDNPVTVERGNKYIELGATALDNYDGVIKDITIENIPTGMNLGTFIVTYKAVDSSGNIGTLTRTVNVVDTIPPTILGVEDGVYYKNPVSIYFIPTYGTDEVLTGWLNGIEISSPYYLEDEGEYDLVVTDDAGNTTSVWFAIDTTPPLILGIKNGEYTNAESVTIYSNEKLKYYTYRYSSGDWMTSEEQTMTFTQEGIYRIQAVDMADNTSDLYTFVIDRTTPTYTLTGVLNKGITSTDVSLVVEEGASVVVNSKYNIPTIYTFTKDGYYQVTLRDYAGNTVNLQFVINKGKTIVVNEKSVTFYTQHNAIDKITIQNTGYPRSSGYMLVIPNLDGTFQYVSGKLFSEEEYIKLSNGEKLEYNAPSSDDTFMYVAFVVDSDQLTKFETQTVDEEDEKDKNKMIYAGIIILLLLLLGGGFFFFIILRKREDDEDDEEEEEIIDDYIGGQ